MTDPFPGISRCIVHALTELGLPIPDRDGLRRWIGPPLLDSFRDWFERKKIEADPDAALALYRQRFADIGLYENAVYEGIPEALDALVGAGHSLLLATAKPEVFARRIVAHFSLDRWLQQVHGSELDGRRGNKTELLQHILDEHGLDANLCMMIGDREHDMLAARHHGISAIGVLWGYGSEEELRASGAESLVREPQQLPGIIATQAR